MKVLKGIGLAAAAIAIVLGAIYMLRTDPIGPIAGKELTGTEAPYPDSWAVCNEHDHIAVETNPAIPYSVTTWCFLINNELHIPSGDGATRIWTQIVTANPNVRIRMGKAIYPAKLTRVLDLPEEEVRQAILSKYPEAGEMAVSERPGDVWIFRAGPRD